MFGLFKNTRRERELAAERDAYRRAWAIRESALMEIAALYTPNAAHGVKKAVRIAREALEQ